MNSGAIGMLVALLVRANRQRQQLAAYGLSEHYREILDKVASAEQIGLSAREAAAPPPSDATPVPRDAASSMLQTLAAPVTGLRRAVRS